MSARVRTSIALLVALIALTFNLSRINKLLVHLFNDDEDILASTCEYARHRGFGCHTHHVTTTDGYILELHRILPFDWPEHRQLPANRTTALLIHGCECDSSVYVANMRDQSLAFILLDAGVDVWLGNVRGTIYSKRHVSLDWKEPQFWNFTFQEMAQIDLPTMVQYILHITKQDKLHYVGHSQGSLMALVGLTTNELLKEKIQAAHLLSPIITLENITSPVQYFVSLVYKFRAYIGDGIVAFYPPNDIAAYMSLKPNPTAYVTEFVWNQFSGYSSHSNRNQTRMRTYYAHGMAGTSVKNVKHFGQMLATNQLAAFDHDDPVMNQEHYGSSTPPAFDISTIQTPVSLYHGDEDWLVSEADIAKLTSQLPNVVRSKRCDDFAHLDFIWGLRAAECAYLDIRDDLISK